MAIKRTGNEGVTKNGKTRYIPLSPDVLRFIGAKINKGSKYILGGDEYVIASSLRCSYQAFFERLNKVLTNMGVEPINRKSPHATRHTFGTLCQKNGMPLAIVSELLGHSSTTMTDQYTHMSDVGILKEAVQKYSLIS